MKKKIFISSLLGVLAAFCLTFAFMGAGRSVNADTVVKNKDIVMDEAAAIRTANPMGIRFTAKIKNSVRERATDCGMYICPADLLPEYGVFPTRKNELESMVILPAAEGEEEHASADRYIKKVSVEEDFFIEGPGSYDTMRVAIVDILNGNIDREFSAMAYVADGNGNETYTDAIVTRCISDVAKAALADPDGGLESKPAARTYLERIKADSSDIVMKGEELVIGTFKDGEFSRKIHVQENITRAYDLKKEFRNAPAASVTLEAKASAPGMKICGHDVGTEDFVSITLGASHIQNNRFVLTATGTGDLYIDSIRLSCIKSLGLDGICLGGTTSVTPRAVRNASLNVFPNGNIEYYSAAYGYSDVALDVSAKEFPEDEYLAFRFRYNADMEGEKRYFVSNEEGFWFHGDGQHEEKWFSVFSDDYKDYTIYTEGENGTPHGSYHGSKGLTTKPDTWYYAVAQIPGNPGLIKHYYPYCHMEISGLYSVPGVLKEEIFQPKNYPGKDFVALGGEGVKDLGLGVLGTASGSDITLTDDQFYGHKNYSSNAAWGFSKMSITIPKVSGEYVMSDTEYFVIKFMYGEDNGWEADEGLRFAFNYSDGTNPYLQVFDEEGYDYTRYNSNDAPCGTYRNGRYSTKPGTWYYMLNRAGIPTEFEAALANQRYVIGGVYAITEKAKDEKFVKDRHPVLLRMPYESAILSAGTAKTLTADITGASFGVNGGDFVCVSGDSRVATVTPDGVVTGVGPGECDITVSLAGGSAQVGVIRIKVADLDGGINAGLGNVRELPLDKVELREKEEGMIASYNPTLEYDGDTDTLEYIGGASSNWGNIKFSTGGMVAEDEYLVLKFMYYGDMEEEETKYFGADDYKNEGLWIQGYDYAKPNGTDGSGHEKDYFSIFDEDYYDYTKYRNPGDASAPYEGSIKTVPYGSFHGTKGITTKPGTWYYAIAPVKGNYRTVGSCNNNLHIKIGGIYAVKQDVRDLFVPQHYRMFINPPYEETRLRPGLQTALNIADNSIMSVTADNLEYTSSNGEVATVDGNGNITAGEVTGTCVITISAKDNSCDPKTVRVTVLPAPSAFDGDGISTSFDLHNIELAEKYAGAIKDATLTYNEALNTVLYHGGTDSNWGNVQFTPGGTVPEGQYLVIKFRYTEDQYFGNNIYLQEGLMIKGYGNATDQDANGVYFSVFDEDYYDYTVYRFGDSASCGAYHGRDGLSTQPETWYYAVAPFSGNYTGIGSANNYASMEIAGVYAVTEGVKNEKFVAGNYPAALSRPAEFTATGDGVITQLDLSAVTLRGDEAAKGRATFGYNAPLKRLLYRTGDNASADSKTNIGFTLGETADKKVGDNDYVVFKFRYFDGMFFPANQYADEGLWLKGYGPAEGRERYFATFGENFDGNNNYYDYTLYERLSGDSSYEGQNTDRPYGSFHGTKGLTTNPGTWYYAVAPVTGGFEYISSYTQSVYIEVAGIYAVNAAVKNRFRPQNYPLFINLPYGALTLDKGKDMTLDPAADSVKSLSGKTFGYTSSNPDVASVDGNGKITGKAEGTCEITVSLEDCEPKTVAVTVEPGPKTFSGTGIEALNLDDLSVNHEGVSLDKLPNGRLEYNTPSYAWREARIFIGGERRIGAEEYLVIKFRYFDDMWFDKDTYSCEGLWPMGYDTSDGTSYFAIFDEDYNDYTIYKHENDTPYGSYHGTDGLTTKPGTWYFAVAPKMGDWTAMSSCNNGAHLEIAGFYAVTSATKENLFKKGVYPGAITAPDEITVLAGESRGIANIIGCRLPSSENPVIGYSSDSPETASVTEAGVVTGVNAGECFVTVTYLRASKRIKVHVLSVPEPAPLAGTADEVSNLGINCITERAGVCKAGNMAHFEVFASEVGGEGHDLCRVGLTADVPADRYLVFKAMYTPGMQFTDRTGDEGLWLLGHRNDAIYNTSAYYDYFSVFGEDGTDYTIYNSAGLPYGSYHNFSKEMTTEPYTWYYFVAPKAGNYTDFGSYLMDTDLIIGGVYTVSKEYYTGHFAANAPKFLLTQKLETTDPANSGVLAYYPELRERCYGGNTGDPNEFRLAAYVPGDKYICFEAESPLGFDGLNLVAVRGRSFYGCSLFGADEDKKDYTLYRTGDVLEGACGMHNTAANTTYRLIAPLPGNFDRFELWGNNRNFNIIIKNVLLLDEETRNEYIAVATNNSAASQPSHKDGKPVIRFGVLADSHLPCPHPHSGGTTTLFAEKNFRAALTYFKAQNIDALLLNGDIVDDTAFDKRNDGTDGTAYVVMNGIMDSVWGGKNRPEAPAHVIYTLGNHEYYYGVDPEDTWSEWERAGYTRWQSFEMNGYTFISLDISTGPGNVDDYTKRVIEKRLAAADAADPTKPIFVTLHIPPLETVLNNTWGPADNDWINSMLEAYPQIVMFGSHTHYSTRHPQSINQNRATVVNVGPGTYGCVPLFNPLYELDLSRSTDERFNVDRIPYIYANESDEVAYQFDVKERPDFSAKDDRIPGYNDMCTGLVVSVYAADDTQKPNKVEIERVNILTGEKIGPDWSFTATKDRTRFVYTKAQMKAHYGSFVPQLKAEECSVGWDEAGENLIFNLRPSNGNEESMGDNIVDCYKVEIFDGDTVLYTKNYVSDYWLTNGYGKLENFKMLVKEANRGKALDFKITAIDAYGHLSNEITLHLDATTS